MNRQVHNFGESLAKSHAQADAPWWGDVYRQAFPSLQTFQCVRKDGWAQRGGIDRLIVLSSGKVLHVDEKVREKDWPDFALERWSDKKRKTPGWMQKDLACDYIAYAFIPSRRCFLLPFQQLRTAWLNNGRRWIEQAEAKTHGCSIIDALNHGYETQSVCVPINEVLSAVRQSMTVVWGDA